MGMWMGFLAGWKARVWLHCCRAVATSRHVRSYTLVFWTGWTDVVFRLRLGWIKYHLFGGTCGCKIVCAVSIGSFAEAPAPACSEPSLRVIGHVASPFALLKASDCCFAVTLAVGKRFAPLSGWRVHIC